MNISKIRGLLSALCVVSILAGFTKISAGPVRFDQVVQIVNARPNASQSGSFSRLRLADDNIFLVSDDEDKTKIKVATPQDDRVIIETRTDIVTDDVCDCEEVDIVRRGFPKWALLGLVAIPIAFIWIRRKRTPTPTPTLTVTPTPGITPTPTPGITPTPTPTPGITPTPTPTPGITPTPTPTPGITPTPTPTPGITPTPTPTPTPGITPTPTPGITPTPTPTPGITPTPTPTPDITPTPTPRITPTPTPMITPSPTPPEPVPEPMTILLFGTGLASIGLAARRKFGKKRGDEAESDEE